MVTRLTRDIVGKQYAVYMDNFFSGIPLFQRLLDDGSYATGTLRLNRTSFPDDLKSAAKKGLASRGGMEFRQDGNLVAMVWQDTKPVTILPLSTIQQSQQL